MEPLFPSLLCAVLCLVLSTTIAGVDGLYFHLYRYRLYARPASRYEHKLHTINAVLFVPQVVLLFCLQVSGLWLWLSLSLRLRGCLRHRGLREGVAAEEVRRLGLHPRRHHGWIPLLRHHRCAEPGPQPDRLSR